MKIKRKQILRLKEVLALDRNERGDEFINLLRKDITNVLSEYFVFEKSVDCDLEKDGEDIKVTVTLTASRIKPFGTIPE